MSHHFHSYIKRFHFLLIGFSLLALTSVQPESVSFVEVNYRGNGIERSKEIACLDKEPGVLKDRNGQLLFASLKTKLKTLRKKKKADPSNVRILKRLKNTRQLFRAGKKTCSSSTGSFVAPPTPSPTPGNSLSYYDVDGNVTEQGKAAFGIPASLEANMITGMSLWQSYCLGCHEERRRNTFDELRAQIAKEPMYYDETNLPDEDLAHIMAWVSRFRFPK